MPQSTFDPEAFEATVVNQEMETHYTPLDEGEYEPAFIDGYNFREVNEQVLFEVNWKILDEKAKEKMGREDIIVKQGIFLDAQVVKTDDGRDQLKLEFGPNKNVKLGKLREAMGQNKSGQPWSFSQLKGAGPAKLFLGQRASKQDPEAIYNDVLRVSTTS